MGKVKGAARLAWVIIQIIALPLAVVGTLFLFGVFRKRPGTGDNGSGAIEVGDNLHDAGEHQQAIAGISERFGNLIEEGRDILAGIRNRGKPVDP